MLTIATWKWTSPAGAPLFTADHVHALREGFARHCRVPHELVCITDDAEGLDPRIRVVPMPPDYATAPRCRRRMQGFSTAFAHALGERILYVDLDIVLVGDVTLLLQRPEPLVCWRVAHARVFSGSFLLTDAGVLDGAWQKFQRDPLWPGRLSRGIASDQAMLNDYLRGKPVARWTEADGFVTYFGAGYEAQEHHGIGPTRPALPAHARVVVLGSADLDVLHERRYPWVDAHWHPRAPHVAGAQRRAS